MLDLNLPPHVARLAAGCLLEGMSAPELMHTSAENCAAFAAATGFSSFDEFLAAIDWLAEFYQNNPPRGMRAN